MVSFYQIVFSCLISLHLFVSFDQIVFPCLFSSFSPLFVSFYLKFISFTSSFMSISFIINCSFLFRKHLNNQKSVCLYNYLLDIQYPHKNVKVSNRNYLHNRYHSFSFNLNDFFSKINFME